MKLSRTVLYALQATLQLAETNAKEPTPCSKLAANGSMPERFLLQILRSLVTHGILQSTRGVEGGYTLIKPPEDVSLLEIIEAIDGPIGGQFPANGGLDERSLERLTSALDDVTSSARQKLHAVKLSQIIEGRASDTAPHLSQAARSAETELAS
ncbi:MAG: Rrf2 family transcriptional regulator [Planctomycetales bacterium]|nr:Rrf2 family transcriptional regulator [Planctomycetales bacterium]MCA9170130.1 Rrf2 family transcriptional regulator [Planctomycetales bacterium]